MKTFYQFHVYNRTVNDKIVTKISYVITIGSNDNNRAAALAARLAGLTATEMEYLTVDFLCEFHFESAVNVEYLTSIK